MHERNPDPLLLRRGPRLQGRTMLTYGPCQTPALWFCVQRHREIEAFRPQPYYTLALDGRSPGGRTLPLKYSGGDIADAQGGRVVGGGGQHHRAGWGTRGCVGIRIIVYGHS